MTKRREKIYIIQFTLTIRVIDIFGQVVYEKKVKNVLEITINRQPQLAISHLSYSDYSIPVDCCSKHVLGKGDNSFPTEPTVSALQCLHSYVDCNLRQSSVVKLVSSL